MEKMKISKPVIMDLLGITPRMRRHVAPRNPMNRMYCGKVDLIRPRVTLDDVVAMESADRRYREMTDIYDAEMAVAHASPAR